MAERLEKPSGGLPQSALSEKTHKTADPRPHSTTLDALRGIAILGIVLAHVKVGWDSDTRNSLSLSLWNIDLFDFYIGIGGAFCLTLFFLLSGYLLTWTEGRRASKGDYSLRSYALRRALRLIPAYYVALSLIFLMRLTNLLGGGVPTFTDTLAYLMVLQSFVPKPQPSMGFSGSYWYLTSELVFYALLPILILKIRGLYPRLALFGVLVAASAMIQAVMYMYPSAGGGYLPYYLYGFPLTHLWVFMAGVLLRMLVEHLEVRRPGDSWPKLAFSLFAGSLAFLALLPYVPFLGGFIASGVILDTMPIMSLAAIPFFAAALLGSPVLSRILSWRLLGLVGVISYSFYLIHSPLIMLVGRYVMRLRPVRQLVNNLDGVAAWLAFAGYLGAIVVVAGVLSYLGYRYIESPFLRYKPK